MANEQHAQSRDLFLQALEMLPSLPPWTKDRETAYLEQFLAAIRAAGRQKE